MGHADQARAVRHGRCRDHAEGAIGLQHHRTDISQRADAGASHGLSQFSLGQPSAAQRVLYELGEEMEDAVGKSLELGPEDMYAFAPEIDARSMLHERQRTRLYIS